MKALRIAHLFPDLLNLYGDGGNVKCLAKRCEWRGIPVEIVPVNHGETIDFETVDLVFLGGGPDREQRLASEELFPMKDGLKAFVEADGALLAICGGFQMLGNVWLLGDESVEGLGVLDIETKHADPLAKRLIDNIVLRSRIAQRPIVGYENHAGRTYLGNGVEPFGRLISSTGHGNNDTDRIDGVLFRCVVGTYLHGPLLAKNPEVADYLLECALGRHRVRTGEASLGLAPLDDDVEVAANEYMVSRLGAR